MSKNRKQALGNSGQIIERFGGIRPMAAKISTPVTTVEGWKKRDVIPGTRREQIIKAASENNIDLSDLLDGADVANENAQKTNVAKEKKEAAVLTTSIKKEEKSEKQKSKPVLKEEKVSALPEISARDNIVESQEAKNLKPRAGIAALFDIPFLIR